MRERLSLQLAKHEIVIRNQQLALEPPLERARHAWIAHLHRWLNVVCAQPVSAFLSFCGRLLVSG